MGMFMHKRLIAAVLAVAATALLSAQTGPVINDSLVGKQVFPASNWWNLDVTSAPVDGNSQAYIDWISGRTPTNPTAVRKLHPDFGPPPYGIPYVTVPGTEPLQQVYYTLYGNESDAGAPGRPSGFPIPDEAKTTAGYIEGNIAGGGTSGDRHLLVIDRDNWLLFETWYTHWNQNQNRWEAGSGAVFNLSTNGRRPEGWTSADAAGLAILPGLVRHDDITAGQPIKHAFRVTTRSTNGHVWPASHTAGSTAGAPPMGARLRLKAGKNISGFPAYIQTIFQAMKTYGLIVADNGTDMYITGTMDPLWNNDELNPAFAALTADDFEVLQLGWGSPTAAPALSLSMTDSPDPVTIGNDVTYSLVVTNSGSLTATAVTVTDTLPAGGSLVTAFASQGNCSGTGPVSCALGSLSANAQATVTVVVHPSQTGAITNSGSVVANEAEVDMTDNSASQQTTVVAQTGVTHIGDLDGSAAAVNKKAWKATVQIVAHDAQHNLLGGATVTGKWSGGSTATSSCTTNGSGTCAVATGNINTSKSSASFDITGISYNGWPYDATKNHDPDGSSTGTHVVVLKP
jgi:uncharacterized repeat protein (TIGR01451 family)